MNHNEVVRYVWELTRPQDEWGAAAYYECLDSTLTIPAKFRFEEPFYVKKPSGGQREIWPAARDLRFVHSILAHWIQKDFPQSSDYCYTGKSVLGAVRVHIKSSYALIVDLKDAFEYVTVDKVRFALRQHKPHLPEPVREAILDLVTFGGRTPQGCVSTPYLYNLVMRSMDIKFRDLVRTSRNLVWSRYSDNICFSSPNPIHFERLEQSVEHIVRTEGFELSWKQQHTGSITFLGVVVKGGNLEFTDEKLDRFERELLTILEDPNPYQFQRKVVGKFNHMRYVYGSSIPQRLLILLEEYFGQVGNTPLPLAQILAKQKTQQLL